MKSSNPIRILLGDDQEVVRLGYRCLFASEPEKYSIVDASSSEEAYQLYLKYRPHLLVIELALSGSKGLEVCRRVLHEDSNAKILVSTLYDNEIFMHRALATGVRGYISKTSSALVVNQAIHKVLSGDVYIGEELVKYLVNNNSSQVSKQVEAMTPRQFDTFRMLAEGKSVNEIAEELNLSNKTIGYHYNKVKQNLGVNSVADLTRIALRLDVIHP